VFFLTRRRFIGAMAATALGATACGGPRGIGGRAGTHPPAINPQTPVQLRMEQGLPELAITSAGRAALVSAMAHRFPEGSTLHFFTIENGAAVVGQENGHDAALMIAGTGGAPYTPVFGLGGPRGLVPLDAALRVLNWRTTDAVTRLAMRVFETPAGSLALPYALSVARIMVPREIAAAAGLGPQTAWTLEEFTAAIHNLSKAYPKIPPLGGQFAGLAAGKRSGQITSIPPFVWLPFVYGFGGSLVDGQGRLSLTSVATLAGLQTLVDLVANTATGFSGIFNLWAADTGSGFVSLPYPRMPVRAVLPFVTYGWGVAASPLLGQDALLQAARWLTVLYEPSVSPALAGSGITLATEDVFARQPTGTYTAADLSAPEASLPVQADGSRRYLQAIGQAVAAAVQDPTQLERLLGKVQVTANADLAPG